MPHPVGLFDLHAAIYRTLAPLPSMKAGNLEYCAVSETACDELLAPAQLMRGLGARSCRA
jgi:hypothetical protein